jgi:hypothetical protein
MKVKSKSVSVRCGCGVNFLAVFRSGVIRWKVECPNCKQPVSTARAPAEPTKTVCAGCNRPLLNQRSCTYCGRPVKDKEAKGWVAGDGEAKEGVTAYGKDRCK